MKTTSVGKIIISGEHSVVYGYPALAIPLPLYTTVEIIKKENECVDAKVLQIIETICHFFPRVHPDTPFIITSSIPQNSGLGSSAALSHALLRALTRYNDYRPRLENVFSVVQECE